jgi:hypothetical protein
MSGSKLQDFTKAIKWRNLKNKLNRQPDTNQNIVNKSLLSYIETLEAQIKVLERHIDILRGSCAGTANGECEGEEHVEES